MIVLDTSVLSLTFRRRPGVQPPPCEARALHDLIGGDTPLVVPGVVLQEILSGVLAGRASRKLGQVIEGFVVVLADRAAHRRAAAISVACRRRGIATSTVDCLIAAQAIELGGELFTTDGDFSRMAKYCPLRLYLIKNPS